MRSYLRALAQAGVVERELTSRGVASDHRLTSSGEDLLGVSAALANWLAAAPEGEMRLGSDEARNATRALVDGWSAGMVRALAARPVSLTELDGVIASLSYPALERRLTAMRLLGMVEASPAPGTSTPYMATPWLRESIAVLASAILWERRHRAEQAPPITNRDVEAGFLLALPRLRPPAGTAGVCRLAVRMVNRQQIDGLVGVTAQVKEGAVVSCVTALERSPDAWAHGEPSAWISALRDGDAHRLELGGDSGLARNLVEGMHRGLQFQ